MSDKERILYQELRKAVENQFGHGNPEAWTQKHFTSLSEEIQEKTGQYLSSHTLRRVFGHLPNPSEKEYLPQLATLDIFCQYVGWLPWLKCLKESKTVTDKPEILSKTPKAGKLSKRSKRFLMAGFSTLLLLVLLFYVEKAMYQPSLVGVETAGTAPFRVLYRVDAPYIGYHTLEVIMTHSMQEGSRQLIYKPIHSHNDPATLLYEAPGIYKAVLVVDGKKTDSLSSLIFSENWFGYFQQNKIHFPGKMMYSDSVGMLLGFVKDKIPDTSRMFQAYHLYYDSTGLDPENFTAEARFLCHRATGGQPWYNARFKVFGSKRNLEVEVIDNHNQNNYLEIRHYFGEKSLSGISSDQRACLVDMEKPVHIRIQNRAKKVTVWINEKRVLTQTYAETLGTIAGLGLKTKGQAKIFEMSLSDTSGNKKIAYPNSL